MEDFGSIIYLIAIVLISIFSSLGKKKKKNSTATKPKRTIPDIPNSWEELEKNFPNIRKEVVNKTTEKRISHTEEKYSFEKGETETFSRRHNAIDISKKEKIKSRIKESNFKTYMSSEPMEVKQLEDHSDGLSSFSFHDQEEAQKAIIYSEIFNRKYS